MEITKLIVGEFRQWAYGTQQCTSDTVNAYAYTITQHCLGKDFAEVNDPRFFMSLTGKLKEEGRALSTISRYVFGVKKFLIFLKDIYGVEIFDLNKIKCRRPKYGEPMILEQEEIELIRNLPAGTRTDLRDRVLFEFLLNTGCRISEAVSLDCSSMDFDKQEAYVIGKGIKPRTVYIGNCKSWVQRYLKERRHTSPALFLTRVGTRLRRANARDAIRDLGRRAGLKKEIYPHMLRATFITTMLELGVNPKDVQRMVGHEDLKTTLQHYYRVSQKGVLAAHELYAKATAKAE